MIVAAGYDSRAWRLARPGVRFFEVHHPATQADKRRLGAAGSRLAINFGLGATGRRATRATAAPPTRPATADAGDGSCACF